MDQLPEAWVNYFEIQKMIQINGASVIKDMISNEDKQEIIDNFKKDFSDIDPKDQLYVNTLSLLYSIGIYIFEDEVKKEN